MRQRHSCDYSARNLVWERNVGLVYHIVKSFINRGVDEEDLVQEGMIGLLKSADRFDTGRGVKFSVYAYHWIIKYIKRAISSQASIIRVPEFQWDKLHLWRKAYGYVSCMGDMYKTRNIDDLQIASSEDISRKVERDILVNFVKTEVAKQGTSVQVLLRKRSEKRYRKIMILMMDGLERGL